MRRRIRSAAFPLHRHSLPQLVVDAGLVAIAYYLAFWLRFDGPPRSFNHTLLVRTWPWVVLGTAVILAFSRVYQRRWRYVTQRDIEHLLRAVVIAAVLLVAIAAIVHPVQHYQYVDHEYVLQTYGIPRTVDVLFPLLAFVFLAGARRCARAATARAGR